MTAGARKTMGNVHDVVDQSECQPKHVLGVAGSPATAQWDWCWQFQPEIQASDQNYGYGCILGKTGIRIHQPKSH